MVKPPRPWLAALLSLPVPGVGQLYAGRPKRALVFFLATILSIPTAGYSLLLISRSYGVLVAVALTLGLAIGAAVDAWRVSTRWPSDTPRPAISRWFVVLPVFVVGLFGIDAWNSSRKEHSVEAFRLPSASMEPTLLIGDYLIVDKRSTARVPVRQALIVHESVEEPGLKVLKRLMALPHDTIEMRRGVFFLNGRPQDEPYLGPPGPPTHADSAQQHQMSTWQLPHLLRGTDSAYAPDVSDWGPLLVPQDSFFDLGDNRNGSYDSRYYGFVPFSSILGRAHHVYLSRDSTGAIRWARLGRRVR